jgi:hypothetical protein
MFVLLTTIIKTFLNMNNGLSILNLKILLAGKLALRNYKKMGFAMKVNGPENSMRFIKLKIKIIRHNEHKDNFYLSIL